MKSLKIITDSELITKSKIQIMHEQENKCIDRPHIINGEIKYNIECDAPVRA